jgi:hypothetical protein
MVTDCVELTAGRVPFRYVLTGQLRAEAGSDEEGLLCGRIVSVGWALRRVHRPARLAA